MYESNSFPREDDPNNSRLFPSNGEVYFFRPDTEDGIKNSDALSGMSIVSLAETESLRASFDPSVLWKCVGCKSDLVQPLEFPASEHGLYRIVCECPDCLLITVSFVDMESAERFSDAIEDYSELLRTAATSLADETDITVRRILE